TLGGPGARRAGGAGGVRAGLRGRSAHGPIVAPKAADGAGNDAARPRTAGLRSGGRAVAGGGGSGAPVAQGLDPDVDDVPRGDDHGPGDDDVREPREGV